MKMIIEISGGVVQNIETEDEISIYVIDHDNLKDGTTTIKEAKQARQPDFIGSEEEIIEHLNEIIYYIRNPSP